MTLPLTNSQRSKKNYLKRTYGLTVEQWQGLIDASGLICPICLQDMVFPCFPTKPNMACIDHCHTTGIVRGAICHTCNKGMGTLGDDPVILRRAAEHIETAERIAQSVYE